jgi:AcrR family transcriptional regulator
MPRARQPPEVRREAILDAARRVFGALPYDEVTSEAIACEAGVTRTLLYHYFANKHDIAEALAAEGMAAVDDLLQKLPRRGGPAAQVRALLDGYARIVAAQPALVRIMAARETAVPSSAFAERAARSRDAWRAWSASTFPAARVDAAQFVLMVLGAMVIWVLPTPFARALGADGTFATPAVERYTRALCDVLLHGLTGGVPDDLPGSPDRGAG